MQIGFTNDFVFKYVFGTEEHAKALCGILNAVLHLKGRQKIVETTILNPFNLKDCLDDKLSILDIKAKDGAGRLFNLEMQLSPQEDYIERVIYYASRMYGTHLKKKEPYNKVKRVISISFLNWKLKEIEKVHSVFWLKERETNQELTRFLEYHFVQLSRFDDSQDLKRYTSMERWLYVLLKGEELIQEDSLPAEILEEEGTKEAVMALKRCSADERMRMAMLDREKAIRDHASSMYHAEARGEAKGLRKGERIGLKKGEQLGLKKGKAEGKAEGQAESFVQLYEEGLMNFEVCQKKLEPLRSSLPEDIYTSYLARLHKKVD